MICVHLGKGISSTGGKIFSSVIISSIHSISLITYLASNTIVNIVMVIHQLDHISDPQKNGDDYDGYQFHQPGQQQNYQHGNDLAVNGDDGDGDIKCGICENCDIFVHDKSFVTAHSGAESFSGFLFPSCHRYSYLAEKK